MRLSVQAGTLNFTSGGTFENGTITFTGTGTANLAGGTFTIPSSATFTAPSNNGNYINISGGTLAVNGNLAGVINLNGGVLTGSGTVTGTVYVIGGSQISGTALQNGGTMAWNATGSVLAYSLTSDTLTNLSNGLINFQADGSASFLGRSPPASSLTRGPSRNRAARAQPARQSRGA